MQGPSDCVVSAIESILKTNNAIEKVKATGVENLPTVRMVCSWVKQEGTYQGADLTSYSEAVAYFTAHHHEYTDSILACLKRRKANEESELLTHALNILATQGWGRGDDASFGYIALQYLATRFEEPLENAISPNCRGNGMKLLIMPQSTLT